MHDFEEAYQRLNPAQRQAVDAIDGPVLVLAGPGTGKTQLLSARVANILKQTDTPANTILCLTFTESGATNMRERLTRFIGQTAYEVNIGTYHAFGGDLIRRYPEYFAATRQQSPIDDLGKRQILLDITEQMSYSNPLKQTRHHVGDLMSTISELKRALITPDALRSIATENLTFIQQASQGLQDIFEGFTTMPRKLDNARPYFDQALTLISNLAPAQSAAGQYGPLAAIAAHELQLALATAEDSGKTAALTAWKNDWLVKDNDNHFIFDGSLENRRMRAMATVLEQYQSALEEQGLYDFDDMILRAIDALETHANLRFTLQERYLYVLLDEFQDTNAAQLKLIQLLTNNPVHEGRPNVMAVGDDDQAIYAFQGAQYSNMLDYYQMYRDVLVVNLSENYRSHGDILETAHNIAAQIAARLHHHFDGMTKTLTAANRSIQSAKVERRDFQSPIAERAWIADQIATLIASGVPASEIAVLAPKHKHLEPLVPYLNRFNIPVRYEKRENILEAPIVEQLLTMSRLLVALSTNNQALANHLWPQVLSYDFWQLPIGDIWQAAWQVSDAKDDGVSWSQALLQSETFRVPALLMLSVAGKLTTETSETILDMLIGNIPMETHDARLPAVTSPLRSYYTSTAMQESQPEAFYQTVSHLTVLRARLAEHQESADAALSLVDFLRFIDMYIEADQQMINTSPYAQAADAVQLMTVFKSKGLEFAHVFLVGCLDDVWGTSARDNTNRLTLPPNLTPIRHAGASEDERLRILFVAITRAKNGLYMTSANQNYAGKPTKRLKFFDERQQPDDTFTAMVLPAHSRGVIADSKATTEPELALLELDWRARHLLAMSETNLQGLLSTRLEQYQISPTHVTDFINLEYAGPQKFFFKTLLRFPETPIPDAKFGTAIHQTLEWIQLQVCDRGVVPPIDDVLYQFRLRLTRQRLSDTRTRLEIERGEKSLRIWLRQRSHIFKPDDVAEKSMRHEGIFIGSAHMAGQIDRLEVDREERRITVVDYKTGKPYTSWRSDPKLSRYRLQLCLYKLLVEGSQTYKDYTVVGGRLEFIEPDDSGHIHALELRYTDAEMAEARMLVQAVWKHVMNLNFPDTSQFADTAAGIKAFVQYLTSKSI